MTKRWRASLKYTKEIKESESIKNIEYSVGSKYGSYDTACYSLCRDRNNSNNMGGFVGYNVVGTTEKCYYDETLNPDISAVGNKQNIESSSKEDILYNICEQINGKHDLEKIEAKPATETEETDHRLSDTVFDKEQL